MKIFTNKGIIKKIVIMLVLVTTFSFVTPNLVHASVGGKLFTPISEFLVFVSDKLLGFLQAQFMGDDSLLSLDITSTEGTYLSQGERYTYSWDGTTPSSNAILIKYSPGIIFSGTVSTLGVNFINPEEQTRTISTNTESEIAKINRNWRCHIQSYHRFGNSR